LLRQSLEVKFMETTETGDQSGGLWRRDGGSTPAKSGQRPSEHRGGEPDKESEPHGERPSQSTNDKNQDGAFEQILRKIDEGSI
jgi:hypothetical protein